MIINDPDESIYHQSENMCINLEKSEIWKVSVHLYRANLGKELKIKTKNSEILFKSELSHYVVKIVEYQAL